MDQDSTLLSALKYITGERHNICRLCLCLIHPGSNNEISIEEEISLPKPYLNEPISYLQMFSELGFKIEPLLPTTICCSCSKMTTNCYIFHKLWDYSVNKWNEALAGLADTMKHTDAVQPNTRSAYLLVNRHHNIILASKRKCSNKTKKNALIKIKEIMKNRRSYAKTKEKGTNIMCQRCGETFKCKFHLTKHINRIHMKSELSCKKCPKGFITQTQLEEHYERVHMQKIIQCPKCPKKFGTQRMLNAHDKVNHVATICKLCFIQLPSKTALRNHLDKHDTNTCPYCSKNFLNRQTFKSHMKICKEVDKLPNFFCDICNKGYLRKNGLRTHLKIYHGFGNVLSCKWCNKKFDAISRLKNHIVKHTKEKNFHCEHCGRRFVTQPALTYHIRLHTGEKPFPCDLCSESFLSASRRMEHKRRKHFERTKECTICHVKFVTKNQLQKHIERHNNPQSKLYVPIQNISFETMAYTEQKQ